MVCFHQPLGIARQIQFILCITRDAEDELNLPGDAEGLMEAYQWALVAKAQVKGDAEKLKAVGQTLKGLEKHLSDKQIKNATGRADKLLNKN